MALDESRKKYLETFVFYRRFEYCDKNILNKIRELGAFIYLTYYDAHVALHLLKETKKMLPNNLAQFDHEAPISSVWHWTLTEAIIKVCQMLDTDLRNETASLPFLTYKLKIWWKELRLSDSEIQSLQHSVIAEFEEIVALRDKALIHLEPKKQIQVLTRATQIDYVNSVEKILDETILPWLSSIFTLIFEDPKQIHINYDKANRILDLLK